MNNQIDLSKAQKYLEWLKTKLYLDSRSSNAKCRAVKRGQVYWCNFGVNVGSEMSKSTPRPCVIVQNNIANKSSPNTIVCPITHDNSNLPCIVPIKPIQDNNGNIVLDGYVNVSNIVCVSKARLGELIYGDALAEIKEIEIAIARHLSLINYYNDLKIKYDKQCKYVLDVKNQRNILQDFVEEVKELLNASNNEQVIENIHKLLDNHK